MSNRLNDSEKEVLDLTSEVNHLNKLKTNLQAELSQLADQISKSKESQIDFDNKAQAIINSAKVEAQKIKDEASDLHEKVKGKEQELNQKEGDLTDRESKICLLKQNYENMISSNEGMKKDLEISAIEYQNKISKLNMVLKVIKEHLEVL